MCIRDRLTGDAVQVPPLMRHAFSSSDGTEVLLFHFYAQSMQEAAQQIQARTTALAGGHSPSLILTSDDETASSLAMVAQRWLEQRSISVHTITVNAISADSSLGGIEARLDLEACRNAVIRTIDRAAINSPLRQALAGALRGRLPLLDGPSLRPALNAVAACRNVAASGHSLLVFMAADEASVLGMAFPVLLEQQGLPLPAVLHAPQYKAFDIAMLRRAALSWVGELTERIRGRYAGTVPSAGRWTSAHLAILDDLRILSLSAARALSPQVLDLLEWASALNAMIERVRRLRSWELRVPGCESFDAENRTGLAIEWAVARQLSELTYPVAPTLSSELSLVMSRVNDATRMGVLEIL